MGILQVEINDDIDNVITYFGEPEFIPFLQDIEAMISAYLRAPDINEFNPDVFFLERPSKSIQVRTLWQTVRA